MPAESIQPDTPRSRGDTNAPHMSPVTPAEDARTILLNKISWGAVFAGVVVALVVQLILNLFGIGIGAATLDPGTDDNPSARTFSIVAGMWWMLSGIIASFAGGYAAGRLAGQPKESTAGWHGVIAWALTTIVIFYLLTSAVGGILGGAYNTITGMTGSVASTVGGAVRTVAPGIAQAPDPFSSIEQSLRSVSGGNDPAALRDAATVAMRAALTGDQAQVQDARERAAQAIAKAQNISIEQARTQTQQYEQQYRQAIDQAKQKATQAADVSARAVARGALFGSIALLLGAIASWFGGRAGAVDPTVTSGLLRTAVGRR